MDAAAKLRGIDMVLDGKTAAQRFELPADLEGDFVALGDAGTVIGSTAAEHDLSGLSDHRLRSHGGLAEQRAPFLVSAPLAPAWRMAHRPRRNYDILDAALNGAMA